MENDFFPNQNKIYSKKRRKIFLFLFFVLFLSGLLMMKIFFVNSPKEFVESKIFSIEPGFGLRKISFELKEEKMIKSRVFFETLVIFYGGEKRILEGDYLFEPLSNAFDIARRISKGTKNISPVKITTPEGFTNLEMAEVFAINLPNFDKNNFLSLAEDKQGYLFPDTYFFSRKDNEEKVIETMQENYEKKISPLRKDFNNFGKTEEEIIVMASLIEGEASGRGDRELISGVLWQRLKKGMFLQVDVSPVTYRQKGLPEKPILNPGLSSVLATINPEYSDYLFYIHGKDGNTYFAKTYEEHKRNINKYLK